MRFFLGIFGGFFVLSLLWITAIWLQSGRYTTSSQWVADVYEIKKEASKKAANEGRIVIIGGSSALFGIDSKALEEHFMVRSINGGVNAGLMLPYVLLKSREIVQKGDLVLAPFEYSFYNYDGVAGAQMIDQIWARDRSFFWELGVKEKFFMLFMTEFRRIYDGFLAKGTEKIMIGPYGYANVDEDGNQIRTSKSDALQWSRDMEATLKELPRRYGDSGVNKASLEWIEKYAAYLEKKGAKLIILPPSMMEDEFYKNDEKQREFYNGLREKMSKIGVKFLGNPYEFMYERDMMFNTDYHLTDEARVVHTKKIEKLLEADEEFVEWVAAQKSKRGIASLRSQ
ncbi:MAG: hypothetical protein PHQ93_10475 [Sulfurimonas sp.]|uniref:hypothetical protein n=1 Tax=Sulfurimonas sp. TaxID=2022749 RepID=UPI0026208E6A|nr:hypothetical protein [Sulfurimonas sp.]MDD5401602.1 hypothetical protein [Sulfurimonas sp.]